MKEVFFNGRLIITRALMNAVIFYLTEKQNIYCLWS